METFITVLQILACLLTITLILLQPSKGGSFFTASNQGVFGSSGGTNFLFKATMWCAAFLAASCIFLSWVKVREASDSVVTDSPVTTPVTTTPAVPTTTAPAAPAPTTTPGTETTPAK